MVAAARSKDELRLCPRVRLRLTTLSKWRTAEPNERVSVMNHAYGWMGGGMWIWTVIGALVVVLLVVAINKVSVK